MFKTGDVIAFESVEAGKRKYHLCVSLNGHFLFLNSPKARVYPGDFIVPASEFPFLPQGVTDTIISCTLVMRKNDAELRRSKAKRLGAARIDTLRRLVTFIDNSRTLPQATKDIILNGLGDWL